MKETELMKKTATKVKAGRKDMFKVGDIVRGRPYSISRSAYADQLGRVLHKHKTTPMYGNPCVVYSVQFGDLKIRKMAATQLELA